MYSLQLTRDAQSFYEHADVTLVRRLNRCFEQLKQDPYDHPNIKRLKGTFSGCYRYRVGDWRVVYEVLEDRCIVIILVISHRSKVYR